MNKKGFTLVELLAVIAILAILVIIALPNVMGMFNEAKKNSFTTEIKEIYKVAEQTWISDSMFETKKQIYSRCPTCNTKNLELTGRNELDYYIEFNKSGNIVKYYATDHTYQYKYDGDGLKVENITGVDTIADLSDENILVIENISLLSGYIYSTYGTNIRFGQDVTSILNESGIFTSEEEAKSVSRRESFQRHKIVDNMIVESHLGIIVNGNTYYIKVADSGSSYESNKNILNSAFSNCTENSNYMGTYYNCSRSSLFVYMYQNGYTYAGNSSGCGAICYSNTDGSFVCTVEHPVC